MLLPFSYTSAQKIGFAKSISTIVEQLGKDSTLHYVPVVLDKDLPDGSEANVIVKATTIGSASSSDYSFKEDRLLFKEKDQQYVQIVIKGKPLAKGSQSIVLELVDEDGADYVNDKKKYHTIVIDYVNKYNPYRLSIGASFDFFENLSATDLYGDVYVFVPSVTERIGFEVGVYQNRSVSIDSFDIDSLSRPMRFDQVTIERFEENGMSMVRYQERGIRINQSQVTIDNLGFYLTTVYDTQLKSENFSLYGNIYFELIRREFTHKYNIDYVDSVTRVVAEDSYRGDRRFLPNFRRSQIEAFFGLGSTIHYLTPAIEVLFNANLGYTRTTESTKLNAIIRARIIEGTTGIKLGVDYRGTPYTSEVFTVYAAKEVSLAKIVDLFTKK
ncbi:hypothetical protein WJR50_31020 [Catalinimonas sp. 4WD22]|uniref:hypothetical protein n=1 Tax=Catalinimonas locisalis TaxID=3133978 RepID=UPI003100BD72